MHGAAARRGGYTDVPADIFAGAKMHGAAARRGGYTDVPADIFAGAKMHGFWLEPPEGWRTGCTP